MVFILILVIKQWNSRLYTLWTKIFSFLGLFINGWSILRFLKTIHGILFSHGSLLNLSAWDMCSIISAILKSASWEKEMVTNINHVSNFLQFGWLFWRRLLLAVTSNSLRSRAFWAGKSGTRFSKYCHHIRCITPRSRGFCCMKVWRNYFG